MDLCPGELLAVRELPALGPGVSVGAVVDLLTAAVERHLEAMADPDRVAAHLVTELRLAMDAGRLAAWVGAPVVGPPVGERCGQVLRCWS